MIQNQIKNKSYGYPTIGSINDSTISTIPIILRIIDPIFANTVAPGGIYFITAYRIIPITSITTPLISMSTSIVIFVK